MPVDAANCTDEPSEALNPTPNMMSHAIGWTNEITTRYRALTYRVISRSQIE